MKTNKHVKVATILRKMLTGKELTGEDLDQADYGKKYVLNL